MGRFLVSSLRPTLLVSSIFLEWSVDERAYTHKPVSAKTLPLKAPCPTTRTRILPSTPHKHTCYPLPAPSFQTRNSLDTCSFFSFAFFQSLLVLGFSSGVFGLYEMPDCNAIHTLSVGQAGIGTCDVNATGDWLAFGCARLGQVRECYAVWRCVVFCCGVLVFVVLPCWVTCVIARA